ncbi:MAG: sigma-54 dependent transcriptional regulator [Deltaproteobacteria bacterium]|nr:sigma-54 dependent transcriptional regulator [Deltaproteobacteria bacterium]
MKRLLLVDSNATQREQLGTALVRQGWHVVAVGDGNAALQQLQQQAFEAVISEIELGGDVDGLAICRRAEETHPDLPVILLNPSANLMLALAALRARAADCLVPPFDASALQSALTRVIADAKLQATVRKLRSPPANAPQSTDLLGRSPAITAVYDVLDRVGATPSSVLLTGESGTGKEVVARALAARSARKDGPFVAINCAAMPANLLESELFGHTKGAFTDARTNKTGLFVRANGGTLLLDEVGDMPIEIQPKLLRALQDRRVRPVGGETEIPFDARIIAATNRDLEAAVAARTFREDLYFRLAVITIDLPPLRTRGDDVLLLAQHFVLQFAAQAQKAVKGLSPQAAQKLASYTWPGNVRELRNCIERAVALTRFDHVTAADLPERVRKHKTHYQLLPSEDPKDLVTMDEIEKRYILRVLKAVGGSRTEAARILGLDRKTLYRKLERYGVASGATPP